MQKRHQKREVRRPLRVTKKDLMKEFLNTSTVTFVNPEKREKALKALRRLLGIDIRRVVKWASNPPTYSVFIGDKEVLLGSIRGLVSQARFRQSIFMVTDQVPRQVHSAGWESVVDRMVEAMERAPVPIARTGLLRKGGRR